MYFCWNHFFCENHFSAKSVFSQSRDLFCQLNQFSSSVFHKQPLKIHGIFIFLQLLFLFWSLHFFCSFLVFQLKQFPSFMFHEPPKSFSQINFKNMLYSWILKSKSFRFFQGLKKYFMSHVARIPNHFFRTRFPISLNLQIESVFELTREGGRLKKVQILLIWLDDSI